MVVIPAGGWVQQRGFGPTHLMPIPPPPLCSPCSDSVQLVTCPRESSFGVVAVLFVTALVFGRFIPSREIIDFR